MTQSAPSSADQLSPWVRLGFVLVVLGLVGALIWTASRPGPDSVANWRPDGAMDLAARALPLLVNENACASGQSARGRIQEPEVDYRTDAVVITIRVQEKGRDQTCPSNPDTRYVLQLEEPIGARQLLDGGQQPPAPPRPKG